jgi:hypothetical protein
MVADYNGWADLPEAEREALDILELSQPVPSERRSHAPVKLSSATSSSAAVPPRAGS